MQIGMIPHGTAFQLLPTMAMSRAMLVQPLSSLPSGSATSPMSARALAWRCGPSLQRVMTSGPAPLSTAAAVFAGRSVWLMNSNWTSTPLALVYSRACSRRTSSMTLSVFDQVSTFTRGAPSPLRMNVPRESATVVPAVTPRNVRRLSRRGDPAEPGTPVCLLIARSSRVWGGGGGRPGPRRGGGGGGGGGGVRFLRPPPLLGGGGGGGGRGAPGRR